MKIGILTFFYGNNNFGGRLQAFALEEYLIEKGYNVEIIQFDFKNSRFELYKKKLVNSNGLKRIEVLLRMIFFYFRTCLGYIPCLPIYWKLKRKENEFKIFADELRKSETIYNTNDLLEIESGYDVVICGSDVIWSDNFDENITGLGFFKKGIKFSYAASKGDLDVDSGWIGRFGKVISCLDGISVREKALANELMLNGVCDVTYVVDPTLLLTREQWSTRIARSLSNESLLLDDYVLCYLLGDSYTQRRSIKLMAKENNLKLITLPYSVVGERFRWCDVGFGDKQFITGNPYLFLNLIKNANMVITDSYHGVIFSCIFKKNFKVLPRIHNGKKDEKLLGRTEDFLSNVGLSQYLMDVDDKFVFENQMVDYKKFEIEIAKNIEKSSSYIEGCLRNCK